MAINHTLFQNVALAISAYAQERWTQEQRINSTGLVTSGNGIDTTGESFIGQLRWFKPVQGVFNQPVIGTATAGSYSTMSTSILNYIKNVRTLGVQEENIQSIISRQEGIPYVAGQFAQNRAQDEHAAVLSTLKGVAAYEKSIASGGGITTFTSVPSATVGAFVDLNAAGEFGAVVASAPTARKLIDSSVKGADRGARLFRAMGMFWKDYEPDYLYMITSPAVLADLREANLIDLDKIRDGNLDFQTIFNGKFRLVVSRADQGDNSGGNVNTYSTKTTFLVQPGAISFNEVAVPTPTEIQRDARSYGGGGTTELWYRYGFVSHPMGYNWAGASNAFATNALLGTAASWTRVVDPLNLKILPIFHG
jgi:hypothetical protein